MWNFFLRNIEGEDADGKFLVGPIQPFLTPSLGDGREFFWDEKATIRCEAFQDDLFKRQLTVKSQSPPLHGQISI